MDSSNQDLEELKRLEQQKKELEHITESTPTPSQNCGNTVSNETKNLAPLTQRIRPDVGENINKVSSSKQSQPTSRQEYSSSVHGNLWQPLIKHHSNDRILNIKNRKRSPVPSSQNRNITFDTYESGSIRKENQQSQNSNRNFVSRKRTISLEKDHTPKQKKHRPNLFPTYEKRQGTSNLGKEYEQVMCGLYALKFSTCNDVEDFEMTSNNAEADILFDDINIKVTFKEGREHTFLFQLKHKENEAKDRKRAKGQRKMDFKKYLRSSSDKETYILYTNCPPDIDELRSHNLIVEKCRSVEFGNLLLNSKKDAGNVIFCLKSTDETESFYYFSSQFNVSEAENNIKETLQNLLHCNVSDPFLQFMAKWWSENYILTKHDFISKVTEMAFSPFLKQLSGEKHNEKTQYIKKAIMDFQVTIVAPHEVNGIESIWTDAAENNETYLEATKKFNLLLSESSKVLWYLDKVPLVVKVDEANVKTIQGTMELLQRKTENKKIILVGNISRNLLENWDIFENLNDLTRKDSNGENIRKILDNFKISFQGRQRISLNQLDETITSLFGVGELLEMSQKYCLLIGEPQEELPELHIPRLISVQCVKQKQLLTFYQSTQNEVVIIINCNQTFQMEFTVNTMDISDYLNPETDKKFGRLILLSRNNRCSHVQFEEICEMSGSKNVFLLQIINDEDLIILHRKGHLELQWTEKRIKEADIYSLETQLNVFCAPPGMGKSRLMKVLSNSCPSTHWSLHVDLINCNSLLGEEQDPQKIFDYFFDIARDNCLTKGIKTALCEKQKMHLFLDGMDELDTRYVSRVIDVVKYISSKGVNVWLSSRENLREVITRELHVLPMEIKHLDQEQQTDYICRKLRDSYEENQIEKIVSAMSNSADLNNSRELLGIPLQLHIITEMFLNDKEVYENLERQNIFVLTQMYKLFFDGKIKTATEKVVREDQRHQLGHMQDAILKSYEILAVKACLDTLHLTKLYLNTKETKKFVNELKTNGDKYGIVRKVNEFGKVIFDHQTYAEYFACVWFQNNQDQLRKLRDVIFSKRYENLRLMLDVIMAESSPIHLAIIYKNLNLLEKNIGDINEKDEGGRSVLHLACCYGTKIDLENMENGEGIRESSTYVKMMEILLNTIGINLETDNLFSFGCIQYACKQRCLYAIEIILEKQCLTFHQIKDILLENFSRKTLAAASARLGYPYLLSALIGDNPEDTNQEIEIESLLEYAVVGLSNDDCTTPRMGNIAAIKVLLQPPIYSETLLDLACEQKCLDMLKILTEAGFECTEGNTIWHMFAEIGHMSKKQIHFLENLDIMEDVNSKNYNSETPLQVACRVGNFEMVKVLIVKGGKINAIGYSSRNLLHFASESKMDNRQIINLLVGSGVEDINGQTTISIDACDAQGITPLLLACQKGNFENVEALLCAGANPTLQDAHNRGALHYASQSYKPNHEIINLLAEKEVPVNARDAAGITPLLLACQNSVFGNVEALLCAGADPIVQDAQNKCVLHYAFQSRKPNHEIINLLVEKGSPVNARDSAGITPLLLACENGVLENVEVLLRAKADPTVQDEQNKGVLHYSFQSYEPNHEIIHLLVDKGAPVDLRDSSRVTPLLLACQHGVLENIETLLCAGADPTVQDAQNKCVFHYAFQSREPNHEIINLLVEKGAPVNAQDSSGITPLLLSCENGVFENVEALLRAGADPNIQDAQNKCVLHYAFQSRTLNHKIIALLLEKGAPVNSRDSSGITPLLLACQKGALLNVTALLRAGADPTVQDAQNKCALHYAFQSRRLNHKIINLLLEYGVPVNARDSAGITPLLLACESSLLEYVEALLRAGADPTAQDAQNRGTLHYAFQSYQPNHEIINLLMEKGAPVNVYDSSGITPLLLACQKGVSVNIEALLRAGADPTVQDAQDRGVLHYAFQSRMRNNKVINLLVKKGALVNAYDAQGVTPLLLVCRNGGLKHFNALLRVGADADVQDAQNRGLLHYAALSKKWNEEIIYGLVKKGASVNAIDATGATPLLLACQNGVLENVEAFLSLGAFPFVRDGNKSNALHYAVKTKRNNDEIINLLIRKNIGVNSTDVNGMTPLQLACQFGCPDNVTELIKRGANVNVVDNYGNTPLHYACRCQRKEWNHIKIAIKSLVNRGINMNRRNKDGKTALDIALTDGRDRIVELLRELELASRTV